MSIYYFANPRMDFVENELGWIPIHEKMEFLKQINRSGLKTSLLTNSYILPVASRSDFLPFQSSLPRDSILVMLYADETYSVPLSGFLLKQNSVKGIIRPYSLGTRNSRHMSGNLMRAAFYQARRDWNSKTIAMHFIWLSIGYLIMLRICRLRYLHRKFAKPSINGILGYTNLFSQTLRKRLELQGAGSLLTSESVNKKLNANRTGFIYFVGQRGKYPRQSSLYELKLFIRAKPDSERILILERTSFGGGSNSSLNSRKNAMEYIDVGLDFDYCLTPPGNYSWNTFRFMEAIVLGSLPLMSVPTICDPVDFPYLGVSTCSFRPWREIFELAERQTPDLRLEELLGLKQQICREIESVNIQIEATF